jgi:hypothetical protein
MTSGSPPVPRRGAHSGSVRGPTRVSCQVLAGKLGVNPRTLERCEHRIVEERLPVVVGDANGADKAVQRF